MQILVTDNACSKLSLALERCKSSLFSTNSFRNLAKFFSVLNAPSKFSDRLVHTTLNSSHCHGVHSNTDCMPRIIFQMEVDR
jgi:hypothetical protein